MSAVPEVKRTKVRGIGERGEMEVVPRKGGRNVPLTPVQSRRKGEALAPEERRAVIRKGFRQHTASSTLIVQPLRNTLPWSVRPLTLPPSIVIIKKNWFIRGSLLLG